MAITTPVMRPMIMSNSLAFSWNATATELTEEAMELIWEMLPMPNAASAPNTEKMTPSHFHLGPRPFLM